MAFDDSSEIKPGGSTERRLSSIEISVTKWKERLTAIRDRLDKIEEILKDHGESASMSEVAETRLTAEVAQLKEDITSIFNKLDKKPSFRDLEQHIIHVEKLIEAAEKSFMEHGVTFDEEIRRVREMITEARVYVDAKFKALTDSWYKSTALWISLAATLISLATLVYLMRGR